MTVDAKEADYLAKLHELWAKAWPKGTPREPQYLHGEVALSEYLRAWAKSAPQRPAVIFYGHVTTYADLDEQSDRFAALLMQKAKGANATVTVVHSGTPDIARFTRDADILIAAIGKPEFVRGDMIKPGAAVIDVGINRTPNPAGGRDRLVGDVKFDEAVEVAGAVTPVPGGVGPMTIAVLMSNAVTACERRK